MRLVIASDTHDRHDEVKVPDGDVFIHCGDFTMAGYAQEIIAFGRWVSLLPHKHKIIVAGNHDFLFETRRESAVKFLHDGWNTTIYLQDSGITLDGVKFWGSPWQPRFGNFAFNLDRGHEINKKWLQIPIETDVLITHGPPYEVLDLVPNGTNAGCADLLRRVQEIGPEVHAFGHIHEGAGMVTIDQTIFVNASICDGNYRPTNPCRVVDI